jgi:hypothetical protein
MRRGIVTVLSAAAVTSAVMATAGFTAPAHASTRAARAGKAHEAQSLPVIATDSYAGYETSTRDFRYIHSVISVPNQPVVVVSPPSRRAGRRLAEVPDSFEYPQAYIQLSNGSLGAGDTYARAGVETCVVAENLEPGFTCDTGVQWVAFVETFINSSTPVFAHFVQLNASPGDGIGFSIYDPQKGTAVYFTVYAPSGAVLQFQAPMTGPVFDHAAGLADYTNSSGTPIPLPTGTAQFRITQFQQGAVTTDSGNKGSWTGPWVTSQLEATTNGLPFPQGTVETSPSYLWTDGAVANGAARSSDAFGVWERA